MNQHSVASNNVLFTCIFHLLKVVTIKNTYFRSSFLLHEALFSRCASFYNITYSLTKLLQAIEYAFSEVTTECFQTRERDIENGLALKTEINVEEKDETNVKHFIKELCK